MEFQYLSDSNARVILSAFQMSPEELPGYAHLSRGTNSQALSECLDKSTQIITPSGLVTIEEFLGGNNSVDTTLWNGTSWVGARVFTTGKKKLTQTVLNNGISIKTSPDHSFRVVGEDGEPTWKTQSELRVGDYVLVNKTPVEGIGQIPSYNGQQLTPEMMEVLGWLTGDGNIQANRETSHSLKFFYHHSKEADIWGRHVNAVQHEKKISSEEAESIKEMYGFKSVADRRIWTTVNDSDFVRWLFSIGFKSSSEGKVVPSFISTLPEEYRSAFLRGLFSADGGISKASCGSVILTAAHDDIRHGVRQLLLTLGIRTRFSEGTTKQVFKNGSERETVVGRNKLYIKDKRAFFERVGFLQDHKQPLPKWLEGHEASEKLPLATQIKYFKKLLDSNLPRPLKRNLYGFEVENTKKRCSVSRMLSLLDKAGIEKPTWLEQYHCEQVESLTTFNEFVEMADVTMYDDTHAFIANGMVVHNSNNEYKLSAARDVGIRPLLSHFQDFLNERLFPLIDEELSKLCYLRLVGLDAETPEKEAVRIQQDAPIHMTFDDVLQTVEKRHIGRELGGKFPFNPQWQQAAQTYLTFGEIQEAFFGKEGAAKNPENQWYQNPMWFQWKSLQLQMQQFQMQQQQMQQQQQMAQQQAMAQQQGGPEQGPEGGGPEGGGQAPEGQEQPQEGQPQGQPQEGQQEQQAEPLTRNLGELQMALGKAEHQLNHTQKETLAYQRKMVNHYMDTFERDKKEAMKNIVKLATEHYEEVKDK
jgi:intein/homing endonuclease